MFQSGSGRDTIGSTYRGLLVHPPPTFILCHSPTELPLLSASPESPPLLNILNILLSGEFEVVNLGVRTS